MTVASSFDVVGFFVLRIVLQQVLCLLIHTAAVLQSFAVAIHSPCLKPKRSLVMALRGHPSRRASIATEHTRVACAVVRLSW